MTIEEQHIRPFWGGLATSIKSCGDFTNPKPECLQVINVSSCEDLSKTRTSQQQLASLFKGDWYSQQSVLFCYVDQACAGGVVAGSNSDYLQRANTGLSTWAIDLVQNQTASSRTLGDSYTAHNPKNWITASGNDCVAVGVPSSLQGSGCPFGGSVIGVCETRYYTSTGEIVDSTLLMNKNYQDSSFNSNSDKQSVFTHEIGHCLGLKHTNVITNIMYPSTAGADTPAAGELAAIADAYKPTVKAPSSTNRDDYFSVTGSNAVRQFTFPSFIISAFIGNAMVSDTSNATSSFSTRSSSLGRGQLPEIPPPRGPSLNGPIGVEQHWLYIDGSEKVVHLSR